MSLAVAVDPAPVVVAGGIDTNQIEPFGGVHLHARAVHQAIADIVVEAIVVAGDHRQLAGALERREQGLKALDLGLAAAVGDVTGDDGVVDLFR